MDEKRLDLKIGYSCNNNCKFCVVSHKRNNGDKTTAEIKADLTEGRKEGISTVIFTGGEVTIRSDVFDIISFAKQIGYKMIQIQTNGRMLAYMPFCKKIVEAGANQFSPAVHGHIPELHDYLTQSPGAFKQVIKGIQNLVALDQEISTNTVITKPNYRFLPQITELLLSYGVRQMQHAFVHAIGNAYKNFDNIVPCKSLVKPYVHKALDRVQNENVLAMVEAYPFCFMKGYELHCSERFIPPTEIREIGSIDPDFDYTRKTHGKIKSPGCMNCKYDLICEGPWKEYPEKRGWDEFIPVPGNKLKTFDELVMRS